MIKKIINYIKLRIQFRRERKKWQEHMRANALTNHVYMEKFVENGYKGYGPVSPPLKPVIQNGEITYVHHDESYLWIG